MTYQHRGVANFGDLQNEIYLAGFSGVLPSLPMSFAELERRAELAMRPGTWSYVAGGAGDEHTQTYFSDPVFHSRLHKSPEEDPGTAILTRALMFGRPLAWDDLAWLRSLTTLPLVLKGVCHKT